MHTKHSLYASTDEDMKVWQESLKTNYRCLVDYKAFPFEKRFWFERIRRYQVKINKHATRPGGVPVLR